MSPGQTQLVVLDLRNLCEHDNVLEVPGLAQQDAARLRHPLEDQRARHDRESRKVVVQVLFSERDILDRLGRPTTLEFDEPVDPEPTHDAAFPRDAATPVCIR